MTSITRLRSKSEDWQEQKRLSKLCELQSPDERQSKRNCETNHSPVLLSIKSLLRRGRTEGRTDSLIFRSSKDLFLYCPAKNDVIIYSQTLS